MFFPLKKEEKPFGKQESVKEGEKGKGNGEAGGGDSHTSGGGKPKNNQQKKKIIKSCRI